MKRVKISNLLVQDFVIDKNQIDHNEFENRGSRLQDLSLGLQDPKTLKRVKISNSLFQDFVPDLNQIDHKESENHGLENLESILRSKGPENLKEGQNFKFIISRFRY